MRSIFFLLLFYFGNGVGIVAQTLPSLDSNRILMLNQHIDDNVVKQNIAELEKEYAVDFVFTHGSSNIDGKTSWLRSVAKGGFAKRQHDSVTVEMHGDIAIVRGKLSVEKKNKEKTARYCLRYVRVYTYREARWQMISHFTTSEFHLPD